MSFLFSSDFHGHEPAFRDFSRLLSEGPWEAGILAGDLLDEWLPLPQVDRLLGQKWDEDETPASRLTRALRARQAELRDILEAAKKPIFFVLGNHDVTDWPETDLLINLHGRSVDFRGQQLVGYRWTRMDRYPDELAADLPLLKSQVDEKTILVTHSPPWGILDGRPGARFRFGLKGLNELPPPRLHLFGHVHECAGVEGQRVNGSWPALRTFFSIDLLAGGGLDIRPL